MKYWPPGIFTLANLALFAKGLGAPALDGVLLYYIITIKVKLSTNTVHTLG